MTATAVVAPSQKPKHKQKRTDWSKNDNMMKAVAQWDEIQILWNSRDGLDMKHWEEEDIFTNGIPSRKKFAENIAQIKPKTFEKYAQYNVSKRSKLGSELGRKKQEGTKEMTTKKAKERARKTSQMLNKNKKKQGSGMMEELYDMPSS